MITVRANTEPYLAAVAELRSIMGGVDKTIYRKVFELLNSISDESFIDLVNMTTPVAGETIVVAQPSQRFLDLLETLRATNIDLARLDNLFVHSARS